MRCRILFNKQNNGSVKLWKQEKSHFSSEPGVGWGVMVGEAVHAAFTPSQPLLSRCTALWERSLLGAFSGDPMTIFLQRRGRLLD